MFIAIQNGQIRNKIFYFCSSRKLDEIYNRKNVLLSHWKLSLPSNFVIDKPTTGLELACFILKWSKGKLLLIVHALFPYELISLVLWNLPFPDHIQ